MGLNGLWDQAGQKSLSTQVSHRKINTTGFHTNVESDVYLIEVEKKAKEYFSEPRQRTRKV